MHTRTPSALVALALLAAVPSTAASQIRGSERSSVSQTLDGTTLTVEYHRPSARGRALFGSLVPWNQVWTPGANWATTFQADRDVRLNGVEVPAGIYSVWMIPRQGPWTLTLDPEPKIFHFQHPDSTAEQIHIPIEPESTPHTEMLTWGFPSVVGDAAVLQFAWGETRVPVEVLVTPTAPVALDEEIRGLYVGAYDLDIIDGVGWPTSARLEVWVEGDHLRGRLPFEFHPGDELTFDLVPAGMDRFHAGLYRDGELFNIEMAVTFEFETDGRQALAVRMRGIEGTLFGQGALATR